MMDDEKWRAAFLKKVSKLREAGDRRGVRVLQFGAHVRDRRRALSPKVSQEKAAKKAGMSQSQWARIEAGEHLPRHYKIKKMAEAINVPVAALYRKAGYKVPRRHVRYTKRQACKDLVAALEDSDDFMDFILRMQEVWQLYWSALGVTRPAFLIDHNLAKALAGVFQSHNPVQIIKLAGALLNSVNVRTLEAHRRDAEALLKEMQRKAELAQGRKGEV